MLTNEVYNHYRIYNFSFSLEMVGLLLAKILVIDDEPNIIELIKFNLEKEGHKILASKDGLSGLKLALSEHPDLIILDIMLPGIDGFEVCRKLCSDANTSGIPIIMLSARSETTDKILCLEIGAVDYVTKPFSPRELVARVKVSLRKTSKIKINKQKDPLKEIKFVNITLDLEKFQVKTYNKTIYLTPKEFKLLRLLMSNPERVFSRDQLLDRVWGFDFNSDTRTVDVHIRYLRQKIEKNPSNPQHIITVRSIGYKFEA